jgi:hypothetical protein
MQILIDGQVAATRGVINAVPGVRLQGVAIGNALATNNGYFLGDIDSMIIWRIDPRTMEKDFFARPLTPAIADCWTEFFRSLREAFRNNPECAQWLVNAVDELMKAFRQALAQKSRAKLKEFADMHAEYRSLWRVGKIDDPQMNSLAKRFRAWLEAEGLLDRNDPALRHIVENPCFQLLLAHLSPLSCDPQSVALIQALAEGGQGTKSFDKECFLEMGGWTPPRPDLPGDNRFANLDAIAGRYANEPALRDSQIWYHAEFFDFTRLRILFTHVLEHGGNNLFALLTSRAGAIADFRFPSLICYNKSRKSNGFSSYGSTSA